MGFLVDSQNDGGFGVIGGCVRSLVRRKQVDSVHAQANSRHQLAKELSVPHLIAIGTYIFYFFFPVLCMCVSVIYMHILGSSWMMPLSLTI